MFLNTSESLLIENKSIIIKGRRELTQPFPTLHPLTVAAISGNVQHTKMILDWLDENDPGRLKYVDIKGNALKLAASYGTQDTFEILLGLPTRAGLNPSSFQIGVETLVKGGHIKIAEDYILYKELAFIDNNVGGNTVTPLMGLCEFNYTLMRKIIRREDVQRQLSSLSSVLIAFDNTTREQWDKDSQRARNDLFNKHSKTAEKHFNSNWKQMKVDNQIDDQEFQQRMSVNQQNLTKEMVEALSGNFFDNYVITLK